MAGIDLGALGTSSVSGWDLLWAVLAAIVGWVASIFVYRGLVALLRRTPNVTEGMAVFVARLGKYLVILLGVGIGLAFLGIGLQPLIAVILIVAVVAVLVLRGVADNFAAGVVLQTRHPIKLGDEIDVDGDVGTVVELNGRAVVVHTVDGRTIHLPNATVLGDAIINNSERGARRSDVHVRVVRGGRTDIADVLQRMTDAASAATGVHSRERTRALAVTVSPERLTARVQFWHHPQHGVDVTSAVVLAVAADLEAAGLRATVSSAQEDPPLVPPDTV